MIRKALNTILFFIGGFVCIAQEKDVKKHNALVEFLNEKIIKLNHFNEHVTNYQQSLYRYFQDFDSLKINNVKEPKYTLYAIYSSVDSYIEKPLEEIFKYELRLDSISNEYNIQQDKVYNEITINKLNNRALAIQKTQINIAKIIHNIRFEIQKNLQLSTTEEDIKNLFKIINQELDSFKKKKWTYKEKKYFVKELITKRHPVFLQKLNLFYRLYSDCSHPKDSINFLKKYSTNQFFTQEIWKIYKEGKWENEILINSTQNKTLLQTYNNTIKPEKVLFLLDFQPFQFQNLVFDMSRFGPFKVNEPDIFLTLIVDVSNSMNKYGRIDLLKLSLLHLVNDFRSQDKFIIVLFSDTSRELFTVKETNKEVQKNLIQQIIAEGGTYPNKAIERSYNIMNINSKSEKNNRVILITDGNFDTDSTMKYLVKQGLSKNITFSIVRIDGDAITEKDINKLKNLTEIGKGNYYTVNYEEEVYPKIIEDIKSLRNFHEE